MLLVFKYKTDNKRQQTTIVDNKRLFNGFVLTRIASLRHEFLNTKNHACKDIWLCPFRHRSNSGHH